MSYTANFALVTCIDYRFQEAIDRFLDTRLGQTYDRISLVGSSKDLSYVIGQIDISKRLHSISEVVVIHHENCGAYGDEDSKERHFSDLQLIEARIKENHPALIVTKLYMHRWSARRSNLAKSKL